MPDAVPLSRETIRRAEANCRAAVERTGDERWMALFADAMRLYLSKEPDQNA